MKTSTVSAFTLFFTIAHVSCGQNQDMIRLQTHIDVLQPEPEQVYKSSLPKVPGVQSCGGHGKLISFRLKGCASASGGICRLPLKDTLWELAFIPSQSSNALGIRIILLMDGTTVELYDRAIADSAVQAGKPTILSGVALGLPVLKGKIVKFQSFIYRINDSNVEICFENDTEFY